MVNPEKIGILRIWAKRAQIPILNQGGSDVGSEHMPTMEPGLCISIAKPPALGQENWVVQHLAGLEQRAT